MLDLIVNTRPVVRVRSRAIAGFVQCVSSDQPIIINAIKEIVTPRPLVRIGAVPRLIPTPGGQVEGQSIGHSVNPDVGIQGFLQDNIIASHTCFGGHMDVNC